MAKPKQNLKKYFKKYNMSPLLVNLTKNYKKIDNKIIEKIK
jgi:hypothetical protein